MAYSLKFKRASIIPAFIFWSFGSTFFCTILVELTKVYSFCQSCGIWGKESQHYNMQKSHEARKSDCLVVTAWFPCDCQFPVASAEEGSVPCAHCNSSDPVLAVVRTLYLCLGNAKLLTVCRHLSCGCCFKPFCPMSDKLFFQLKWLRAGISYSCLVTCPMQLLLGYIFQRDFWNFEEPLLGGVDIHYEVSLYLHP